MYISKKILILVFVVIFFGSSISVGGFLFKVWHQKMSVAVNITEEMIQVELNQGCEKKVSKALEKYRQGNVCFANSNFETAISHLEESVEFFPFPTAYLVLGNAYSKKLRDEDAIRAYETAIDKAAENGNGKIFSAARAELLRLKEFLKVTEKFRKS